MGSIHPSPHDEVIVVSRDTDHGTRKLCRSHRFKYFDYFPRTDSVLGGAAERSYGIEQAKGDYLVFLDDDDVLAPGGLEIIREEINALEKPQPLLFRVNQPGGPIWSDEDGPSLEYGHVTGSQFVCPRFPVAEWRGPDGDYPFINKTINLWGGFKAVDRVIILIRPELI